MPIKLKTSKRPTSISRSKVRSQLSKLVTKNTVVVTNKYKCPQKLWQKFKINGQKVYNDVMDQSLKNQSITVHPETGLSKVEWNTICHNFSCYAAWAVVGLKLKQGDTVIDIDRNGNETKRRKVA